MLARKIFLRRCVYLRNLREKPHFGFLIEYDGKEQSGAYLYGVEYEAASCLRGSANFISMDQREVGPLVPKSFAYDSAFLGSLFCLREQTSCNEFYALWNQYLSGKLSI